MSDYSEDGEILNALLKELRYNKQDLADALNKHRNTVTNWMKGEIPSDVLVQIGKVLRYDISAKFPRLKAYKEADDLHFFNEDPAPYFTKLDLLEQKFEKRIQLLETAETENKILKIEVESLRSSLQSLKDIIEMKNDQLSDKNLIIANQQKEIERLKSGQKGNGNVA